MATNEIIMSQVSVCSFQRQYTTFGVLIQSIPGGCAVLEGVFTFYSVTFEHAKHIHHVIFSKVGVYFFSPSWLRTKVAVLQTFSSKALLSHTVFLYFLPHDSTCCKVLLLLQQVFPYLCYLQLQLKTERQKNNNLLV